MYEEHVLMSTVLAGQNILILELDLHSLTTSDYQSPFFAPKIKAVLEETLRDDGVIDVDAA